MTAYYLDSSALMKRCAQESSTAFIIGLMRPSAAHNTVAAIFWAPVPLVSVPS